MLNFRLKIVDGKMEIFSLEICVSFVEKLHTTVYSLVYAKESTLAATPVSFKKINHPIIGQGTLSLFPDYNFVLIDRSRNNFGVNYLD